MLRSTPALLPFLTTLLPTLLLAQSPGAPSAPQSPATQTAPATPPGPNAVDDAAVAFFLEEGLQRSQVMEHLSWICDVYGPRVTGSPNIRKAQKWAKRQTIEAVADRWERVFREAAGAAG